VHELNRGIKGVSIDLKQYKTLAFDCDGVVLNSNTVRADAFYNCALPYGKEHAEALRAYHILHGGVSRYVKFEVLLRDMVKTRVTKEAIQHLLQQFTTEATIGLLKCEIAPGLQELRDATPQANWMLVSGADEKELRDVFAKRNIAKWFDGGIYGSPLDKDQILERELARGNCSLPALFFGDAQYDVEASSSVGLKSVFVSQWTDMKGWKEYTTAHDVTVIDGFERLL
jgi:phosphoglycolate phosphatase-like HAD superfamily hydrolase